MTFEQYEVYRPNLEEVKLKFTSLLETFEAAENVAGQKEAIDEINSLRNNVRTMLTICSIRHSIDTNDEFYKSENDYIDEFHRRLKNSYHQYYERICEN